MKRALVFSLILAVGLGFAGFAQTLSGSWDTDVILDLTATNWVDGITINTEILVDYTVGDWTFSSETDIANGVWNNQDFDFAGVLGAFTISGDLEFDPVAVAFAEMEADASVSIAGVTFGAEFTLWPGITELVLTGSGVAGDVTIDVELALGSGLGCDFDFNELEIDVGFPFCCAEISAELVLNCDGFQYVEFCFEDLTIENLPWLTLGACVKFQTGAKTFTFDPSIDLGLIGCDFDLFYHLNDFWGDGDGTALGIDGINFDGIQIACEIGGVSFTGITFFDTFWSFASGPAGVYKYGYNGWGYYFPGILYGFEGLGTHPGPFFEAYQIATTDDGCCGPFSFDVTVFFSNKEGAGGLFDVAYFVANVEIQLATQFTFGLGLETDVANDTVDSLTLSFEVTW